MVLSEPLASPAETSAQKRLPKLGLVAATAFEKDMPSRTLPRSTVASVLMPESSRRRSMVASAGSSWMPALTRSASSSMKSTTWASLSLMGPVIVSASHPLRRLFLVLAVTLLSEAALELDGLDFLFAQQRKGLAAIRRGELAGDDTGGAMGAVGEGGHGE
jgi:hypothetical protein